MTMAAALRALVLSSLYDTLSAISCTVYPAGTSTECAAGVTKCIQTKMGDIVGTACDASICSVYTNVADGECINVMGSGQLVICGNPGYTSAPTVDAFAGCPESATAVPGLPGGGDPAPTPPPTPAAAATETTECREAITLDANATGAGGTVQAGTLFTCSSDGSIEEGTLGTMCLQRKYPNNNGVTQGCDALFCGEITDRNTCCTDAYGTQSICVASSPSAVPSYADFADCDAPCTLAPTGNVGTADGGAARSSLAAAALAAAAAAGAAAGLA